MRRHLYISLLVCCFSAHHLLAQQPDTASVNHLLKVADKLPDDTAIILFDSAYRLSEKINYTDGAFIALITRGIKYFEKEDYARYRSVTEDALPWAKKCSQKDAVAWCYINIGESYLCEGDYSRASQYYYTALQELKKATGDAPNHSAANIYNSLGKVSARLNQPGKAMYYFDMAEDVSRRGGLYYQLAESFINKGLYYTGMNKPDSADKYFNEVMAIGKKIDKADLQAIANEDLGRGYIQAGEYGKAITHLNTAISLAKKGNFDYIVVDASYSLGDALCRQHRYRQAEEILLTALAETKAHNYKDNYTKCYSQLIALYKATGQYKKAVEYMDTLAAIRGTLANTETTKAFNLMEVKYATAEKDKQIAQNRLLIAEQQNKITRKNTWIMGIGGGVLLLSFVLVAYYRNSRHRQRLQAEQIKSLQHENTIGILTGMAQGEERERSRLARELHDGVGGMLSAVMMRIMSLRHNSTEIAAIPAYREAVDLLDKMGDEIRKTAHNLMPDVLLKQNLDDAIRSFCRYVQDEGRLQINFQSYGSFADVGQDFKLNIYRIVQELLKNVLQHAHATTALVQLMRHENILTVTVEDNGVGFDDAKVVEGIGLHNLQTRVSSLNGTYARQSAPGKGTTTYIEFELKPGQNAASHVEKTTHN